MKFTATPYKSGDISPMNRRVKYTVDSSNIFIECHTKGTHAHKIRSAMQTAFEYLEEELKNNLAYDQKEQNQ